MGKKVKNDSNAMLSMEAQLEEFKQALHQSDQRFQNLIKNIPGIVYLCYYDEHWTMHYIVKEIEKISGYPASDFINNNVRSYASIIHPDDVLMVDQVIQESIANKKSFEIEYRIIRKDGDIAWVYEKGQKVCGQDNKIWLNGIIFDITEHKQTAIALDMATEEWRVTFDAIPNAVFLLNRECRIMKCNLAAAKLLGKKQDNLIGQRYCKVIDDVNEPPRKGPYMHMLKSGHQEKLVRSLGEKIVEFTFSPIINPEREIYGSVLLIVDVTKLKNTENQLKNKNKQLESIFHTAPIGIGVISKRVVVQANEQICKMIGYTKEEIIGQNISIFHDNKEEYNRVGAIFEKIKGREIANIITKLKRKDGRIIDVLLRFSPLNTDIDGFTCTAMDITKDK
jgi:PAS domain S-box-containing protein